MFRAPPFRRPNNFVVGHRLFPRSGGYVDNYPQQNYDNGVAKNQSTGRRYKAMVRCLKRLITELHDTGEIPRDYPGYLTESLVFNVPNGYFGNTSLRTDLESVLAFLYRGLDDSDVYATWTEPSGLTMLFRGHSNRSPSNARNIVATALVYEP